MHFVDPLRDAGASAEVRLYEKSLALVNAIGSWCNENVCWIVVEVFPLGSQMQSGHIRLNEGRVRRRSSFLPLQRCRARAEADGASGKVFPPATNSRAAGSENIQSARV